MNEILTDKELLELAKQLIEEANHNAKAKEVLDDLMAFEYIQN